MVQTGDLLAWRRQAGSFEDSLGDMLYKAVAIHTLCNSPDV